MASIFLLHPSSSTPFLSSSNFIHKHPTSPKLKTHYPFKASHSIFSSLHSSEPEVPPKVQNFWKWLSEEGVISSKTPVKPGVVPEGLGLIALRDIDRNDVVLEVPKRLWINPDTVAKSDIGDVCDGLKPWVSVAVFLIREKHREDSLWNLYIKALPESTNSTVFWSEEELAELRGSQLLSTTLAVKEYVQNEFYKVKEETVLPHKELFPFPFTLHDFFWAFGTLRSRAFSRLRGQNLVIVPLVDLINHDPSITSEDHAHEVQGPAGLFSWDTLFSLRAPVSVKAGEQVMIQYDWKKSNAQMALDYGFIESRLDRNAYTFKLDISESDPLYQDKLAIAESKGLGKTAHFDIVLSRAFPSDLLPYLRLISLGGADAFLLESMFRDNVWKHLELPVSRSNEMLVCQTIREACKAALSCYNTTIQEDDNIMKGEQLDPRLQIAVGVRAGEKKVLQQIDGFFRQRELELDQLEYYQERRLRELGPPGKKCNVILSEVN